MPETDLHQPDLSPLLEAAGAAELTQVASGLVSAYGHRLADRDPFAPLVRDIARSMTETGLPVHRFTPPGPGCRLGGAWLVTSRHRQETEAGR